MGVGMVGHLEDVDKSTGLEVNNSRRFCPWNSCQSFTQNAGGRSFGDGGLDCEDLEEVLGGGDLDDQGFRVLWGWGLGVRVAV